MALIYFFFHLNIFLVPFAVDSTDCGFHLNHKLNPKVQTHDGSGNKTNLPYNWNVKPRRQIDTWKRNEVKDRE